MKKLLIFTNILFLGAAIFFALRYFKKNDALAKCESLVKTQPANNPKPERIQPKPLVDTSLQVCATCNPETIGEEINHFKEVTRKYRTDIWDLVNDTRMDASNNSRIFSTTYQDNDVSSLKGKYANTDARSIWFSLETIKQFICTIETNNAKLKNPSTDLGIRFYYAIYKNDYKVNEGKANRHTIFMVPTCRNGAGAEIDFDPRETLLRQKRPEQYKKEYDSLMVTFPRLLSEKFTARKVLMLSESQPSPNVPSSFLVQATAGMPTFSKNNGEICPTHCPSPNTLEAIDQQ